MLDPFIHRKILNRGVPARAIVAAVSAPAIDGGQPSQVMMSLSVELPGAAPFDVHDRWMVSGTEPVVEGMELRVVVDPGDHRNVAIDWERSHPDYRRRAEVRSKVLSGAVPMPVPAIQDAVDAVPAVPAPMASSEPGRVDGDLISKLERLAALHSVGSLTDAEFAAAKRHVLAGC